MPRYSYAPLATDPNAPPTHGSDAADNFTKKRDLCLGLYVAEIFSLYSMNILLPHHLSECVCSAATFVDVVVVGESVNTSDT